jgi:hypothetical protein
MKSGTILLVLAMAAIAAGHGGGSHYSGSHYSGSSKSSSSSGQHSSNFHGRSSTFGSSTHGYYASGSHHDATSHSNAAVGVERDSHGRIKRSEEAKREFMQQTGYPHGRPGYVVDHIIPLKRGGADSPSNMQWQTIADAKAKDKWE